MKHRSSELDMLHGPLAGKLLQFTLPIALSSIVQQLFNAADTAVVGSFGSADALAAVGTNTEIIALIVTGRNVKQVQHPQNVFWSFPTEAFSGARVDKIDNRIQRLLRNSTEITAFGEEKSQKAVCILICTALPRLVRLGKVDQRVKLLFDLPELRKFTAIIQRDAPYLTRPSAPWPGPVRSGSSESALSSALRPTYRRFTAHSRSRGL